MDLALVVGNPKPRSRTQQVGIAVADQICRATGARLAISIDLADYGGLLFDWPNDTLTELTERVSSCELLVAASPTYKATFTGMIKAFFDLYPNNGLAGVTAIPVLTMNSMDHSMGVDVFFRALLVELGASVPTKGLAFPTPRFEELDSIVSGWADENLPRLGPQLPASRKG